MKASQWLCAPALVVGAFVSACEADGVDQNLQHSIEMLLRREATEIWTQGDLSVIPEIFADTQIAHYGEQVVESTHETMRSIVASWRTAFPDLEMVVDDIVISGDKAAARYTLTGTHLGKYGRHEPTGKEFRFQQIYFARVANGRIAETWGVWDEYGFRRQLGLIPSQ